MQYGRKETMMLNCPSVRRARQLVIRSSYSSPRGPSLSLVNFSYLDKRCSALHYHMTMSNKSLARYLTYSKTLFSPSYFINRQTRISFDIIGAHAYFVSWYLTHIPFNVLQRGWCTILVALELESLFPINSIAIIPFHSVKLRTWLTKSIRNTGPSTLSALCRLFRYSGNPASLVKEYYDHASEFLRVPDPWSW